MYMVLEELWNPIHVHLYDPWNLNRHSVEILSVPHSKGFLLRVHEADDIESLTWLNTF